MTILVVNAGSSSMKFAVYPGATEGARLRGSVERLGPDARVRVVAHGGTALETEEPIPGHAAALDRVLALVRGGGQRVAAVGHRVVHGGGRLVDPVIVDDDAMAALEDLERLAPLHNAASVAGIVACRERLGAAVPMVAVFDTAFHATIPDRAAAYALPWDLAARHGIRRYGFHGTSCRSVLSRYCVLMQRPASQATMVILHLGSGCSATAVAGGRSIDTSMGFTPLEGLMMATRSGDVDPAVVDYLASAEKVSAGEVVRWLNERSGLLGVSGRGADLRDLLAADHPRARLAADMFCYRVRKYLGAYLAALGGVGDVVFTGGVGEHLPEIRARICADLEGLGIALDPARNAAAVGREGRISSDAARRSVVVIPTDEEAIIASDTRACLDAAGISRGSA
jgi:acetate kinase